MGFCLLRLAAAASLVSVPAASDSTAHKVSITVDGRRCRIPVLYQLIKPPEPKSEPNQHYKLHSSSTTKQIDVGLFNLGGFHLADEETPSKTDLPEVLHVLDVLLRRLPYGERFPLALVKLARQRVVG